MTHNSNIISFSPANLLVCVSLDDVYKRLRSAGVCPLGNHLPVPLPVYLQERFPGVPGKHLGRHLVTLGAKELFALELDLGTVSGLGAGDAHLTLD